MLLLFLFILYPGCWLKFYICKLVTVTDIQFYLGLRIRCHFITTYEIKVVYELKDFTFKVFKFTFPYIVQNFYLLIKMVQ